MRRYRFLLLFLILIPLTVTAQRDCGNGLPCGPLPWPLPKLPILLSPSPMPTVNITAIVPTTAPTATSGGPTATPVGGPTIDTAGINDQMGTLSAVMENTPFIVQDIEGTPVDTSQTFDDLGSNAGSFFGYAKGLQDVSFGQMTPLIVFTLIAFLTVVAVKSLTFLLPFLAAVWGFIRKIIETILAFIP